MQTIKSLLGNFYLYYCIALLMLALFIWTPLLQTVVSGS